MGYFMKKCNIKTFLGVMQLKQSVNSFKPRKLMFFHKTHLQGLPKKATRIMDEKAAQKTFCNFYFLTYCEIINSEICSFFAQAAKELIF